jgi:hypothetical protein
MLLTRWAHFLLHSVRNSLAVLFVLFLIPVVIHGLGLGGLAVFVLALCNMVSFVVVALLLLRQGFRVGVWAWLLFALLLYSDSLLLHFSALSLLFAIGELVLLAVFTTILRQTQDWSKVLGVAILAGLVVVTGVKTVVPDIAGHWQKLISTQLVELQKSRGQTPASLAKKTTPKAVKQYTGRLVYYMTGLNIVALLLSVLLKLLFGRWWQAIVFNPKGLRKELHAMRLHPAFAILLLIVYGLVLLGLGNWGADYLPILVGIYFCAGLSLVHCWVARRVQSPGTASMMLFFMYVLLFIFGMGMGPLIVIAAVVDSAVNFRRKLG